MQEERDNDEEFLSQKAAHHHALAQEREIMQMLKGEAAVLRKKNEACQQEMEQMRSNLRMREREIQQLKVCTLYICCKGGDHLESIQELTQLWQYEASESTRILILLRKDLLEREESIGDKERRMSELKAKNKELEKFKFVLDYKLRGMCFESNASLPRARYWLNTYSYGPSHAELKKEIEPRDEKIMQMRDTIRELGDELQRDYRTCADLPRVATLNESVDERTVTLPRAAMCRSSKLLRRNRLKLTAFTSSANKHASRHAVYDG